MPNLNLIQNENETIEKQNSARCITNKFFTNMHLNVLFLFTPFVYSQSRKQITGSVQDVLGNPLIGVSILETGTSNGTITDMNGAYSLNVSSANATLKFSYIGYEEQLIKIQGRNVINVKMNEETSNLDEVVVVGYGVQRKSDLTGAISSINAAETLKKCLRLK
ncbi:carboxypeptidase-like regulatory domain-containing protein [Candidatus Bacteroides intestinigallinarum]|uniref:carboxypeptidase-like regulatory domain-containing protein n=1 Tax=Candidatus Bacteroides intestinigallinarum TaxID=2838470 RepID=UPI002164FC1D|nr:carboxypeptidase-like regulatory domain-containing protein [Candidatus Bacteroides intestinigallinarum]MCS3201361.1 carboxypeptidase-like regulatory domain-containing protein [Candidatus Bacteroides intestinigallinarum]